MKLYELFNKANVNQNYSIKERGLSVIFTKTSDIEFTLSYTDSIAPVVYKHEMTENLKNLDIELDKPNG